MAEHHRNTIDPSVLNRLATSFATIADAWQADIDALHEAEQRADGLQRVLDTTQDRADNLQGDLRAANERWERIVHRNAFLEAQVQRIRDSSLDARDVLAGLAVQADDVSREQRDVSHETERNQAETTETASPPSTAAEPPVVGTRRRTYGPPAGASGDQPTAVVIEDGQVTPRPAPRVHYEPVNVAARPAPIQEADGDGTDLPPGMPVFLRTPLPPMVEVGGPNTANR